MAVSSNASTPADKKALKAIIGTVGKATSDSVDVDFQPDSVIFTMGDRHAELTRHQFNAWADSGHPWDGAPVIAEEAASEDDTFRPQPKKSTAKKKPATRSKAKAPPKKAEPEPEPEADEPPAFDPKPKRAPRERKAVEPAQTASAISNLAAKAIEISSEKRDGEVGANVARFHLGELMIQVASVAKASKVPVKTMLAELNQEALALVSQNQLPDYDPIAESEATATRKVVETFGSSGSFRDLVGINPTTGDPLVDDSGSPFERQLTDVALNKLYPLAKYADGLDANELDTLVSFAFHATEKVVKAVNSAAQKLSTSALTVIRDLSDVRTPQINPLTGEEIMGPPKEKDLMAAVRAMTGDTTTGEEIASLRTARSWYEGTWLPLKGAVDAIAQQFIPEAINESTGATSNVFILERILTQFYHPFDAEGEGIQRILGALVAAGDLSTEKANAFLNEFAFDEETGWVRTASAIVKEAEESEEDADLSDDDIFGDDDLDMDTPTDLDDEEDDGEEGDDDDF